MKKIVLALLMALNINSAGASGIPVVDAVNIAESIRAYVQQLKDYQALLDQLDVENNQYVQMVKDYQQVIKEYDHYLNQIKQLDLSASQAAAFNKIAEIVYGNGTISDVAIIDLTKPNSGEATESVLRESGQLPRTKDQLISDYNSAGVTVTDGVEARYDSIYKSSAGYRNQINLVQRNEAKQNGIFQDKINKSKEITNRLGPESDLQTLQHLSYQQNIMMEQMQETSRLLNQQILTYESPTQASNYQKIAALELEINRLKRLKARQDAEAALPNLKSYSEILK